MMGLVGDSKEEGTTRQVGTNMDTSGYATMDTDTDGYRYNYIWINCGYPYSTK
jgi:hypothetical protein